MVSISGLLASSDHPQSIGARFRRKRLAQFERIFFNSFDVSKPIRILDVGGTDYFWRGSQLLQYPHIKITLLNLHKEDSDHPNIEGISGNATDLSEFKNSEFDLVFSNSVIEHVFTWENQKKMAKELNRVGKRIFVQTPNRYFPIEVHYVLPLAQYWPKSLLFFTLTRTHLSRFRKWTKKEAHDYIQEIRLLNEKEMIALFPGSKILREKVLGLTKSITAHNFF